MVKKTSLGKRELNKLWGKLESRQARIAAARDKDGVKDGKRNVVGVDGFANLVGYGLKQLEETSRVNPTLFRHGTEIAEIVTVEEMSLTNIRALDRTTFKARVNTHAPYLKAVGENGFKSEDVPRNVSDQMYDERDIPLPYLMGKVTAPVFRVSGGLLNTSGYDEETRLYYARPDSLIDLNIPEEVTEDDLAEARKRLVDLFCDFEMDGVSRTDLEAAALRGEGVNRWGQDRDNSGKLIQGSGSPVPPSFLSAVGWLLEQSVRPLFKAEPLMPLLISKTKPGAGGGLLAKCMQIIIEGCTSSSPLAKGEDEIRKAAFASLMSGRMTKFWDNLQAGKNVDSGVLAMLFTEPTFTDRVLGRSEERYVPVRSSFCFVGNRPLFSSELVRRLNLAELVPQTASPEKRGGWKHDNLMLHVTENRAHYLWAVLVLIRNWIQIGKPGPKHAPVIGSYETYSEIIPGILEAASPHWTTWAQNRHKLSEIAAGDENDEMSGFLDFWVDGFGVGFDKKVEVAELLGRAADKCVVLNVKTRRDPDNEFDYCGRAVGSLLGAHAEGFFQLEDGRSVQLLKHDKRGKNGNPWWLKEVEVKPEPDMPHGRNTRDGV